MSQLLITSPSIFRQHNDADLQHTLQDLDNPSLTTPTSSSSSVPLNTFNELVSSPQTAGRRSRDISSRDSITPGLLKAKKHRDNNDHIAFEFKLHNMSGSVFDAFNSFQNSLKNSPSSPRFTRAFYQRIEDYLDQENLNIVIPNYDDIDAKAREAVRRLIIARTVSDNVEPFAPFGAASGDFPSPSLRNNILCSTLAQRRASLSHTSSLEIAAVHESTMIKKSAFGAYKETVVPEEKETPSVTSRRDSISVFSSDLQSALTRRKSGRLSSCLVLSPTAQIQSPSPAFIPTELGKRLSFVSPQKENQSWFQRVPHSPLTCLAKKPKNFEEKIVVAKTTVDTTSFGEMASSSCESTPVRSVVGN